MLQWQLMSNTTSKKMFKKNLRQKSNECKSLAKWCIVSQLSQQASILKS